VVGSTHILPCHPPGVRARANNLLAYGTLIVCCVLAFRILFLWLEYLHFWINASAEVIAFGVALLAHLVVRPRDDARFRTMSIRIVLTTLAFMGVFLFIAFNIRIA